MMTRRLLTLGACLAAAVLCSTAVIAHEDDPKAKHWEPPFVGPAWRLGIEGAIEGGVAESFESSGVQLLSWFPVTTFNAANTSGNDCWGYVSPSGREYALIGLSHGTGIVEITDPGNAQIRAFLPGPQSLWRNIKTYKHFMYAVSEGGGGIQVFDLGGIDAGLIATLPSVTTGGNLATHTMIINEQTGYLYRMGGGSNGLRIYNLEPNPGAPQFVTSWSDKYTHDGCVMNYTSGPYAGKEIFLACGGLNSGFVDTGVSIIDVTNKASLQVLSTFFYPNAAFCHQIWPSEDLQYAYINDEIDEQNFGVYSLGRIVNISNLSAPTLAGTYQTNLPTVDHNEYVRGNFLYCSNYKSGIRVFDITNRTNPVEVAWFDTYPNDNSAGYAGLWSNYPFFPSGTVIGSDLQRGLFVWRVTSETISFAYPDGLPSLINPNGQTITVALTPGGGGTIDSATAKLIIESSTGAIETPLTPVGGDLWQATTPPLPCGSEVGLRFVAELEGGGLFADPVAPGVFPARASLGETSAFTDDFEAGSTWTVGAPGDSAISGFWTRVDPIGTSAQPEDDHTPGAGLRAWITGQGTLGGSVGQADVDGGATTLTSSTFDVSAIDDPWIEYWRWYSNNQGSNPNTNSMPVLISNDNGATWTQIELVNENQGTWVLKQHRISDFVAPTALMRLRFVARDTTGAVVEAGVDDLRIFEYICDAAVPGDVSGDGLVNGTDIAIVLGQWGTAGPGDLDGNGVVDGADLAIVLGNWS